MYPVLKNTITYFFPQTMYCNIPLIKYEAHSKNKLHLMDRIHYPDSL